MSALKQALARPRVHNNVADGLQINKVVQVISTSARGAAEVSDASEKLDLFSSGWVRVDSASRISRRACRLPASARSAV